MPTSSRIFEDWFKTFRKSINEYGYYTKFEKIFANVARLKVEVNILNSLVGSKNIEKDFENLLEKYPECLKVIPILLAVRENEIFCQDSNGKFNYRFDKPNCSVAQYKYFMEKTGLFDLLKNHVINNLHDYLTGVEVGMDSNSRKNRGGHQMERLVKNFLEKANIEYESERYIRQIEEKYHIDLSAISAGGISEKRFDFVVKTEHRLFGIETNFYSTTRGGSKLNETARSYKLLAEKSAEIEKFTFVWITDGQGWEFARKNLKETFMVLPTLYNIQDLEDGIFEELFNF